MKELSIEEKAARYDDAIKRVENIKTGKCETTFMFTEGLFEHIFPELAESKDEKIRKAIRTLILSVPDIYKKIGFSQSDCLVWIEKQGNKDSHITLPTFTFDDILALQCCMETVKKVQEDKDLYEKMKDLHGRVYDAYQLEKQGEQKPTDKCEGCNNAKGCVACVDGSEWAHIEEQKTAWSEESAKEMFIKALERVEEQNSKGYKLTDCDKKSWWEDFKAYTLCAMKQNHAWSEEDEDVINHLLAICTGAKRYRQFAGCLQEDITKYQTWLKSLKDRVQPQLKQEWSKEDNYNRLLHFLFNEGFLIEFNNSEEAIEDFKKYIKEK